MIVGRTIGYLLIVAALAVVARDVVAWLGGDAGYHAIAAGQLWFDLHPNSLMLAEPAVSRYVPWIGPWLWHPVISTALTWPAWLVLGAPGLVLAALCHARGRRGRLPR